MIHGIKPGLVQGTMLYHISGPKKQYLNLVLCHYYIVDDIVDTVHYMTFSLVKNISHIIVILAFLLSFAHQELL